MIFNCLGFQLMKYNLSLRDFWDPGAISVKELLIIFLFLSNI